VVKFDMDGDVCSKKKGGVVMGRWGQLRCCGTGLFGGGYCAAAVTDQVGSQWRYAGGPCEHHYQSEDYRGGGQARGVRAENPALFAQFAELYGRTEEMPLRYRK